MVGLAIWYLSGLYDLFTGIWLLVADARADLHRKTLVLRSDLCLHN